MLLSTTYSIHSQSRMENLGRGVVAVRTSSTQIYVGWRMLGTDPANIAFNLYRSANGGAAVKLNSSPITATTNFVDSSANMSQSNAYFVRPVINGVGNRRQRFFHAACQFSHTTIYLGANSGASGRNHAGQRQLYLQRKRHQRGRPRRRRRV